MRNSEPKNRPVARGPFRIQAVADMTGARAATLRAWERRYGVPRPARTASAYRLYDERDVELVRTMMRLCAEGLSASDAAVAARRMEPGFAQHAALDGDGQDPFAAAVERAVATIEELDADALDRELGRAAMLGSAQEVYERVTSPLLVRVGERWHAGTLSVAHERFATERIVGALRMQLRMVQARAGAPHVLLGAFADEEHIAGLLGAALAFAGFGYRVTVLGARTPPDAIRDAAAKLRPDLIGLSLTMPPQRARGRRLIREYADAAGSARWIVGGRGAEAFAELIESRGGIVATGPASDWPKLARTIAHAKPSPKRTTASRRKS